MKRDIHDPRGERFHVESRKRGDDGKFVQMAGIFCSAADCSNEEWMALAKGKGSNTIETGRRFARAGWGVAKRRADDCCPACMLKSKREREAGPVKIGTLGQAIAEAAVAKLAVPPAPPPAPAPEPPPEAEKAERRVAVGWTKEAPTEGPDGLLISKLHWGAGVGIRSNARKSARLYLKTMRGIEDALQGTHFELLQDGVGWRWKELPKPIIETPEELPMAAPEVPAFALAATPPRTPTPTENRKIMEALEACYDMGKGYKPRCTDETVAAGIDPPVPRAWVEKVRAEFFGPARSQEAARFAAEVENHAKAIKTLASDMESMMDRIGGVETETARLKALADDLRARGVI